MGAILPYCGAAPLPGHLWSRFNPDPILLIALLVLVLGECLLIGRRAAQTAGGAEKRRIQRVAMSGWAVATAAFVSPLCALSVALFSARVAQHMILILVAAPLIAEAMPLPRRHHGAWLWLATLAFFVSLWLWHMPVPYDATFASTTLYWAMHTTLFGSAIWLWYELLHHSTQRTAEAFVAGALTSIHMGLLGALLTFAGHPLFRWHFLTTWVWGFTPLQDQQLGGVIMWVPGIALFLWTAMRSLSRLLASMERVRPA